jgi:uncharacterized RDD family membrane protein YckC
MSSAVQKEEAVEQLSFAGTENVAALKQIASERLAAHRRRRGDLRATDQPTAPATPATRHGGDSRVRDVVAARYQNSLSYREFLTQEAERALEQAHAEAEVAARNAQAVAEAQMLLLEELEQWTESEPAPGPRQMAVAEHYAAVYAEPMEQPPPVAMSRVEAVAARSSREINSTGLTVRLYEDLSAVRPTVESAKRVTSPVEADANEHSALDAEIAFRRAPEFEHAPQPVGISGNLIEFPRQLVATRKARPRLAEGPLREETVPEPQLRIFEVEPDQMSSAPAEPASAPEWQSIMLEGSPAVPVAQVAAQFHETMLPQTARLELRLMAAIVDACCVGGAVLAFAAVVVRLAGTGLRALPLPMLGGVAAVVAVAFFVLYQVLFFTLGEATPGMRYARIGLCTFADSNPTRGAMRLRVLATLLAACPLGLGLAWAWMDEDSLGWHDRISRMYQRPY